MNIADVLALVGLLVVMAGALFGVYLNLSSKIDRCYERLDDTKTSLNATLETYKEQSYKDFLLKSVHIESVRHGKELADQKYNSLNELVNEKLDNLATEIKKLSEAITKMGSHQ